MFSLLERTISLRYLRARRTEGFISVIAGFSFLGIMLGVATLIIVMSVMNGFRHDLMGQILGFNGHIGAYVQQGPLSNYEDLVKGLTSFPQVKDGVPMVERQAMLSYKGSSRGAMVHGLRAQDLSKRGITQEKLIEGTIDGFKDTGIYIGTRLADALKVNVGDKITLITPDGTQTAFGISPRMKHYTLAGIFKIGMSQYDEGVALMPLGEAQSFFRMPEDISNIQIFLKDPDSLKQVIFPLQEYLGPQVTLIDWQRSNDKFFSAIMVERNVMFIILSLIIVIAAFNVISSMIMLVKDKGKDIAILRTMGVQKASIMRIFLLTGSSIGVAGTLGGFLLGLPVALNIEPIRQGIQSLLGTELFPAEIYFLSRLPSRVDYNEVAVTVIMSLVLSILATLYPSWRAAKLDPVEALRYE